MTNKQTINYRKKWIDTYKVSVGCCLCGYNKNPRALCFDHLPEFDKHDSCKSGSKAGGMFMLYRKKHNIEELISEIKKCRVLCHNCHMENTHVHNTDLDNNINLECLFDKLRNPT